MFSSTYISVDLLLQEKKDLPITVKYPDVVLIKHRYEGGKNPLSPMGEHANGIRKQYDLSKVTLKDVYKDEKVYGSQGVYIFYDKQGNVCYVGLSTGVGVRISRYYSNAYGSVSKTWLKALKQLNFNNMILVVYFLKNTDIHGLLRLEVFFILLLKPLYNVRVYSGIPRSGVAIFVYSKDGVLLFTLDSLQKTMTCFRCHYTTLSKYVDSDLLLRDVFNLRTTRKPGCNTVPRYSSYKQVVGYINSFKPQVKAVSEVKLLVNPNRRQAALDVYANAGSITYRSTPVLATFLDTNECLKFSSIKHAAIHFGVSNFPIRTRLKNGHSLNTKDNRQVIFSFKKVTI